MLICELCSKPFKNKSGLSGHRRLVHHLDSPPTASAEVGNTSEPGQPQAPWEFWRDFYADHPSVAVMRPLAGSVEERLERIEGLLGRMKILVAAVAVGTMSGSLEERVDRIEGWWTKGT